MAVNTETSEKPHEEPDSTLILQRNAGASKSLANLTENDENTKDSLNVTQPRLLSRHNRTASLENLGRRIAQPLNTTAQIGSRVIASIGATMLPTRSTDSPQPRPPSKSMQGPGVGTPKERELESVSEFDFGHQWDVFRGIHVKCCVCQQAITQFHDGSHQCVCCGAAIHTNCLKANLQSASGSTSSSQTASPLRSPKNGHNDVLKSLPPYTCCPRTGTGDLATRVTKSSLALLAKHFEIQPLLDGDDFIAKALRVFVEFLAATKRAGGTVTLAELNQSFGKMLRANGDPPPTSDNIGRWSLFWMAFDGIFHDAEAIASIKLGRLDKEELVPRDVAEQLTVRDYELYNALQRHEFNNAAFTKKDKKNLAPHIMDFIQRFNQISLFVTDSILRLEEAHHRAVQIEFFIQTAQCCKELGNFNSLKAILSALQAVPIYRLKKTWKLVGRGEKKQLGDLAKLMSEENNYKDFRAHLAHIMPPCIPFLGVFLTDLTYVDVAFGDQPAVLQEKTVEIVDKIAALQGDHYDLQPICALRHYLDTMKVDLTEKQAYEKSLEREEKEGKNKTAVDDYRIRLQRNPNEFNPEEFANQPPEKIMEASQLLDRMLDQLHEAKQAQQAGTRRPRDIMATDDQMWTLQMHATSLKRLYKKAVQKQQQQTSTGTPTPTPVQTEPQRENLRLPPPDSCASSLQDPYSGTTLSDVESRRSSENSPRTQHEEAHSSASAVSSPELSSGPLPVTLSPGGRTLHRKRSQAVTSHRKPMQQGDDADQSEVAPDGQPSSPSALPRVASSRSYHGCTQDPLPAVTSPSGSLPSSPHIWQPLGPFTTFIATPRGRAASEAPLEPPPSKASALRSVSGDAGRPLHRVTLALPPDSGNMEHEATFATQPFTATNMPLSPLSGGPSAVEDPVGKALRLARTLMRRHQTLSNQLPGLGRIQGLLAQQEDDLYALIAHLEAMGAESTSCTQ